MNNSLKNHLEKNIEIASEKCPDNIIGLDMVRTWLSEILTEDMESIKNEPESSDWSLLVDPQCEDNSVFVFAQFEPQSIKFFTGYSKGVELGDFMQKDCPNEFEEVLDELKNRFEVLEEVTSTTWENLDHWVHQDS